MSAHGGLHFPINNYRLRLPVVSSTFILEYKLNICSHDGLPGCW
nr:hypothetical protein Iba_chr11aCG17610 [Ipomoea batatas]GMD57842.1 hypothetical protein Iba_chr11eCG16660 [Ipomoea batatas]